MKTKKILTTAYTYRLRFFASFVAISLALVLGLSSSPRSAMAFSGCQKVKGTEIAAFTSPTTVEGTVTQGGILNGSTLAVLTSAPLPTADPNIFSFTIAKSFMTDKGVLQTYSPHILEVTTGVGTAFARIDPNASSGIFAGATGILYINFYQNDDGVTSTSEVSGEICFAN